MRRRYKGAKKDDSAQGTMNKRGTMPSMPSSALASTHREQISLIDDNDKDE